MAMPVSDASNLNTVIEWAMGRKITIHTDVRGGGSLITDQVATEAARRLIAKAYKSLMAGLPPERVRLSSTAFIRERLLQIAKHLELTPREQDAFAGVIDVLDRIERDAATAAGEESE
jgi:hypothetical protein